MIRLLANVRDTIHADSLALFAFNIDILLANLIKPEQSNFDLTCDVINDLQIKFRTLFGNFTYRATEERLNYGNQPMGLRDQNGYTDMAHTDTPIRPPPPTCVTVPNPNMARVNGVGLKFCQGDFCNKLRAKIIT